MEIINKEQVCQFYNFNIGNVNFQNHNRPENRYKTFKNKIKGGQTRKW